MLSMGKAAAAVAAVAACGAALISGAPGTAKAAYFGQDGRIAFVRDGDIYSIEPDGAGLTRLTGDGHASGPMWSPDGQRIAYIDNGDLWMMNASGTGKTRLTDAAPGYTDQRASWSPDGQYLAFVKTARHASYGYLTRYNLVTHGSVTFTATLTNHPIKVEALPAPVAWMYEATENGFYLAYEAAGPFCSGNHVRYCLGLLGFPAESDYQNVFPSSEYASTNDSRLTYPDWFPYRVVYYRTLIATKETCSGGHCVPVGIEDDFDQVVLPGAYEAVYSPDGVYFAYVHAYHGAPEIYTAYNYPPSAPGYDPVPLTPGTQPDWQPVPFN
jgi:hypothetical protein